MKICEPCQQTYPNAANYCTVCGRQLTVLAENNEAREGKSRGNWTLFWLTLGGSLLLSWVLMTVFNLPVFILGAILPLFWIAGNKKK